MTMIVSRLNVRSLVRRMLLGSGLLLAAQNVSARQAAPTANGQEGNGLGNDIYVLVSVPDRKLMVMAGKDTLHVAPIAVPSGEILEYGGRRWQFSPPAGARTVRSKRTDPVWSPPDCFDVTDSSTRSLTTVNKRYGA